MLQKKICIWENEAVESLNNELLLFLIIMLYFPANFLIVIIEIVILGTLYHENIKFLKI